MQNNKEKNMQNVEKRSATSPLSETDEKRARTFSDSLDADATIITGDLLSSTMHEEKEPSSQQSGQGQNIVTALRMALRDPEVVGAIAGAVAQQLKGEMASLRAEVTELKKQVCMRDVRIQTLETSLEELEQYQRRNNIRISGIPEAVGEDTDNLVVKLAQALGCDLDTDDIDRSHRVGSRDLQGDPRGPRPILVKFVSYKSKRALTLVRKELKNKKGNNIYPDLKWGKSQVQGQGKIFINDDLTATRAKVAKEARDKKKNGDVQDTWVRDGMIFVKKNDNIIRITNMQQLMARTR